MFFQVRNGPGYFITSLIIKSDGNIGIGTTDPKGYKLAVAGKIVSEGIVVKLQSSWPDYVFEKNYTLHSLNDLEQYIKANKHLPGLPSAGDVKENGLSIGEMNAILLKNLEELTLHLIEKEKKISDIEKRINKLEKKYHNERKNFTY